MLSEQITKGSINLKKFSPLGEKIEFCVLYSFTFIIWKCVLAWSRLNQLNLIIHFFLIYGGRNMKGSKWNYFIRIRIWFSSFQLPRCIDAQLTMLPAALFKDVIQEAILTICVLLSSKLITRNSQLDF